VKVSIIFFSYMVFIYFANYSVKGDHKFFNGFTCANNN